MDNDRVERIRARAHAIWEEEGRPDGREVEHWQRAVSEIEAEDVSAMSETASVSVGKARRRRAAGSGAGELGETGERAMAETG